MVMTRSDRDDRRTRDGFIMECAVCGAYLRWAHLEASANGSKCTFCGSTVVPTRPDGFRDVDERLVEIEDLGLMGERLEETPSLLEPIRQTPRIPGWAFVVVSILVIVGMGVWRLANSPSSPAAALSASGAGPSVVPPMPPASKGEPQPQVATRITAIVLIDTPTWIEVTPDGQAPTSETYQPQRLVFHAKHQMQLWLGHGSGVSLTVNGKHVNLGTSSTSLKLTLLRSGRVAIAPA
jgi:hypothetical protein